jgi:hypothetical protein
LQVQQVPEGFGPSPEPHPGEALSSRASAKFKISPPSEGRGVEGAVDSCKSKHTFGRTVCWSVWTGCKNQSAQGSLSIVGLVSRLVLIVSVPREVQAGVQPCRPDSVLNKQIIPNLFRPQVTSDPSVSKMTQARAAGHLRRDSSSGHSVSVSGEGVLCDFARFLDTEQRRTIKPDSDKSCHPRPGQPIETHHPPPAAPCRGVGAKGGMVSFFWLSRLGVADFIACFSVHQLDNPELQNQSEWCQYETSFSRISSKSPTSQPK